MCVIGDRGGIVAGIVLIDCWGVGSFARKRFFIFESRKSKIRVQYG